MTGLAVVLVACAAFASGFLLAALMGASRRGDDLAELHDRERQAARLRLVLGADDEPEDVA